MPSNEERLEALRKQYDELRRQFISAVGDSTANIDIDILKRKLEAVAAQIRKLDINGR
jgi:hypothetical protein